MSLIEIVKFFKYFLMLIYNPELLLEIIESKMKIKINTNLNNL